MKFIFLLALFSFATFANDAIDNRLTLYFQEDFRGEVSFDGMLNTIGYKADFDMHTPITNIGAGYTFEVKKFDNSDTLHVGGRVMHSFTQDAKTVTESALNRTSTTASTVEFDLNSLLASAEYRHPMSNFTLLGGALFGLDFADISGVSALTVDLETALAFGAYAGIKKDHIRGELQFKTASGSVTGTGVGRFSGLNLSGDYDYQTVSLAFGYDF